MDLNFRQITFMKSIRIYLILFEIVETKQHVLHLNFTRERIIQHFNPIQIMDKILLFDGFTQKRRLN